MRALSPPSATTGRDAAGIDVGPIAQYPGYVFRRAQAQINQQIAAILTPLNLRRVPFTILMLVKYNPGAAPSELAGSLDIARANFVALLQELLQRGLLVSEPRPDDRRYRAVFLTDAGAALVEKAEPLVQALEDGVRAEIGGQIDVVGLVYGWLTR